jgi:hypothetical protein
MPEGYIDLAEYGARVLSVCGAFNSRVIFEVPADKAEALFPDGFANARSTRVVDALERDLELIREDSSELADSALAASALAMAFEIEHPYNSATSKSMCQARLADTIKTLREMAPARRETDDLDDLSARRASRLAG